MTDRMELTDAAKLLGLVLVAAALAFGHCGTARADVLERTPATLAETLFAWDVARVAMNEAGGAENDVALIAAAAMEHGSNARAWRHWLRRHSPCATGVLSEALALQRPGPCRWTRGLRPDGRRPEHFPAGSRWSVSRAAAMAAFRQALSIAQGEVWIVCADGVPESWDGPRWRRAAERRGWEALRCKSANVGYRRPEGYARR